mmetsp:Transcript_99945/g.311386  ORF Transcript_99945/g.311386 Transcript_99945/m.311386 type:complete len:212 (+) Transcript_99945:264-899(+)
MDVLIHWARLLGSPCISILVHCSSVICSRCCIEMPSPIPTPCIIKEVRDASLRDAAIASSLSSGSPSVNKTTSSLTPEGSGRSSSNSRATRSPPCIGVLPPWYSKSSRRSMAAPSGIQSPQISWQSHLPPPGDCPGKTARRQSTSAPAPATSPSPRANSRTAGLTSWSNSWSPMLVDWSRRQTTRKPPPPSAAIRTHCSSWRPLKRFRART